MAPILVLLLSISLILNIYLYTEKARWKDAWLNQFITTSEVENIFKQAALDTTLENIKSIATEQCGSEKVRLINMDGEFQEYELDNIALSVNETLLFFKGGIYHGSKAKLPNTNNTQLFYVHH